MTDTPIDLSIYNELAETTGADFVGELVGAFLDEAPGMIADLKDAAATDDADRFRRAAHSIKSNALIFGAHQLGALAREMELSDLAPALAASPTQLAALDDTFASAATALNELVDA